MSRLHVITEPDAASTSITVRRIGTADLKAALAKGLDDFMAIPTHLAFLGVIYPLFGFGLGALTFSANALPLLFPLVSGFALIGPAAAVGLYELSRRREQGLDVAYRHVFDVLRSPSLPAILVLSIVLMVVLLAWLWAARGLYVWLYGPFAPLSYTAFLADVLTTTRGWTLILVGHAVGFVFAAIAFVIGAVSFPLLLDRPVGAVAAVQTSVRAVLANPGPMAVWALIIAGLVILGSAPLLVGLAVVMPVLGHASWHLYRRVVEPPDALPGR